MISLILGAGFSYAGGSVPLAANLLDDEPNVDRLRRERLVEKVRTGWLNWHDENGGKPEEYLATLQERGGQKWNEAVWFVSLVIALRMGQLQLVSFRDGLQKIKDGGSERVRMNSTLTRHHINRTTRIGEHEQFWDIICSLCQPNELAVVTTNYDILIERGLRCTPRPRAHRFGFNYGIQGEYLEGGGYPSYAHIQAIRATGNVPVWKLHGSVSWSLENNRVRYFHDCRPALKGTAAIIAPTTEKQVPDYLRDIWIKAEGSLSTSELWIVVGYSFPSYDMAVSSLLQRSGKHGPKIHVFTPSIEPTYAAQKLLPNAQVFHHKGIPDGFPDLQKVLLRA